VIYFPSPPLFSLQVLFLSLKDSVSPAESNWEKIEGQLADRFDCLFSFSWASKFAGPTVCTTSPGPGYKHCSDYLYNSSWGLATGTVCTTPPEGLATGTVCTTPLGAWLLGLSVQLLLGGLATGTVCTTLPDPGYWDCLYNSSWGWLLGLSLQLLLGPFYWDCLYN
jgi:hypothetical protein